MAKGALVNYEDVHRKALHTAAVLFLRQGFTATTVRSIADNIGCSMTSVLRVFGSKEGILCELVKFVLEGQFSAAQEMLSDITDDPVLYYAAETALQLYMAESDEAIRNLYSAAYSMPQSSELIRRQVCDKLLGIVFKDHLPGRTAEDFYALEIASGGIIRGYMTVPCTPEFPIEDKVRCFLETSLRIYQIPEDKIAEAVNFVKQFDYPAQAAQTVERMLAMLEGSFE